MYDTIIIGAGLGELIAGAKLTADEQRVLVLEKHSIPGGYATTFERRNVDHEVSLDEIDGFDEADPKRNIFEELGVFDAVEFEPVGAYRLAYGSNDLVLPHDDERAADRIVDEYPHEEEGIRKFFGP